MKVVQVIQDEEVMQACAYIARMQDAGFIVATDPPLPGCVNGAEMRREWVSTYIYHWVHPQYGQFEEESKSPLRRLYVTTYLSNAGVAATRVIPGSAVIFGDRIALYSELSDDVEPLWLPTNGAQAGYASRFLRELVWQAGKAGLPIFPTALYVAEDPRYPYPILEDEWVDLREYNVTNAETSAALVGYGITEGYSVVYLHVAGPQAAVKSVMATLVQGKRVTLWPSGRTGYGIGEYRMFLNPLPGTREYRGILVARSALEAIPDSDRSFLLLSPEKEIDRYRLLARRLNDALPIPILEEWGEALYREAKGNLVTDLIVAGDLAGGLEIRLNTEQWTNMINRMLVEGDLAV